MASLIRFRQNPDKRGRCFDLDKYLKFPELSRTHLFAALPNIPLYFSRQIDLSENNQLKS